MRVLVADDDEKIASYISAGLKQEGHIASVVHDGLAAVQQLTTRDFDAAVLDIMMPRMDGLSAIAQLRDEHVTTPVLILSAKRDVDDKVIGLRSGGDDYMVKPFAFSELLARLEALHRRSATTAEHTVLECAGVSLDVVRHKVTRDGKAIELQPKEFALLEYLLRNAGRVVSKTMIMEHVWGYDFDPETNVVEARISRLRSKLDKGFEDTCLHTVRGFGYVFREDD